MKKLSSALLAGLLAVCLASPVQASEWANNGNNLLRTCNLVVNKDVRQQSTWEEGRDWGYCLGLVRGVGTAMITGKTACMPEEVELQQSVRVVLKWLEARPQALHEPDVVLVMIALREAFPCPEDK